MALDRLFCKKYAAVKNKSWKIRKKNSALSKGCENNC